MFEYKMEYVFEDAGERTVYLDRDDSYLLLLPELIGDILKKLTKIEVGSPYSCFSENGKFNNGYAIICDENVIYKVVREDGTIISNLPEGIIYNEDRFFNDRLLVLKDRTYQYIDGKTGNLLPLPQCFSDYCAHSYFNGLARLDKPDEVLFIDEKFNKVSPESYIHASDFAFGKALVCTNEAWKFVDTNFKELMSYPRGEIQDATFLEMINLLNDAAREEATKSEQNVIDKSCSSNFVYIYINKETGLSIFTPSIIKEIAEQLGLEVPNLSIKEQLVWIIGEAIKKGTYVYDLTINLLTEVELRQGIKVISEKGSVVSFDKSDVEFLRSRVKKEE